MSTYDDTPVDYHSLFKGNTSERRAPMVEGTIDGPPEEATGVEKEDLLWEVSKFIRREYPGEDVIRKSMSFDTLQKCHRWRVYFFPTPGNTYGFEAKTTQRERSVIKRAFG